MPMLNDMGCTDAAIVSAGIIALGDVEEVHLTGRVHHIHAGAEKQDIDEPGHEAARGKEKQGEKNRLDEARASEAHDAEALRHPSGEQVRHHAGKAVGHENRTRHLGRQPHDVLQHRGHIGVEDVGSARAEHKDEHARKHAAVSHEGQLVARGRGLVGGASARHARDEGDARDKCEHRSHTEREVPAEGPADELARRHAEHASNRKARVDERDNGRHALLGHKSGTKVSEVASRAPDTAAVSMRPTTSTP